MSSASVNNANTEISSYNHHLIIDWKNLRLQKCWFIIKLIFTYTCPNKRVYRALQSHWNLSLAQGDRLQEILCPSVTVTVGVKQSLPEQGWQRAQAICCLYCNSLLKKGSVYNLHVWNCYSFKFQIGSAKNTYCGTWLGIHLEFEYGSSLISLKILHAKYKYMSMFPRTPCISNRRLQASISFTWNSEGFHFVRIISKWVHTLVLLLWAQIDSFLPPRFKKK